MSENTFWFLVWIIPGVVACVIAGSLTASDMYATAKIEQMVANGADPIKARCSLYGGSLNGGLDCNIMVQK